MDPYHVGYIYPRHYLFLKKREENPSLFQWFKMSPGLDSEEATPCAGKTPAEAVLEASKHWKQNYFRLVNCGFRYSLPERDEVGCNAFFWEMAKSYAAFNGRYFDEELGHHCYVDFASQEALSIWRKLQ